MTAHMTAYLDDSFLQTASQTTFGMKAFQIFLLLLFITHILAYTLEVFSSAKW